MDDVSVLLNQTTTAAVPSSKSPPQQQQFDVLFFHTPHGWIDFSQIDEGRFRESLQLAHEHFGVKTAIITSIPLSNNVDGLDGLAAHKKANDMIRNFVDSYQLELAQQSSKNNQTMMFPSATSNSTIQHLLLDGFWKTCQ